MDFNAFFSYALFSINDQEVTLGEIVLFSSISVALVVIYRIIIGRWLPKYFERKQVGPKEKQTIYRIITIILLLLLGVNLLLSCAIDRVLLTMGDINIRISNILEALLLMQFARLLDCFVSKIWLRVYYERKLEEFKGTKKERLIEAAPKSVVQSVFYIIAVILILYNLNVNKTIYDFGTEVAPEPLKLTNILYAAFIILLARLFSWIVTQVVLFNYFEKQNVNIGSQYAINQLLKYIIYVIAALSAIEAIGLNLTVIWAGSAALLVGVGLGLQQTFNDLISGIILLFERTVEVGDFVQLDDHELVGQVRRIGWRTSDVETRNHITVIVPNSKLISDNVVNWSHSGERARFKVLVGVAYGTDTAAVKELLIECAQSHNQVVKYPAPIVRFKDFGSSSLDFELLFWSKNFLRIEDIKSDLRFEIDKKFRERSIEIPFPQRDIWVRSNGTNKEVELLD